MYLISLPIGYDEELEPGFSIEKDNWGVSNVVMNRTNRKIRIVGDRDGSINDSILSSKTLDNGIVVNSILDYHLDYNPKNMNLSIFNYAKTKRYKRKLSCPLEEDGILYLTINTEKYKLVNYVMHDDARIVQTYRHDDRDNFPHVGSTIAFNVNKESTKEKRQGIISCLLYSVSENKYYILTVNTYESIDNLNYILKDINDIYDIGINSGAVVTNEYDRIVKEPSKGIAFKISNSDKIITNYVITSSEDIPDNYFSSNVDEISVIQVGPDDMLVNENNKKNPTIYSKMIEDNLTNTLLKNNVRAITTVGVKIPKDFCLKFKILYLFTYDEQNGSRCIKSV